MMNFIKVFIIDNAISLYTTLSSYSLWNPDLTPFVDKFLEVSVSLKEFLSKYSFVEINIIWIYLIIFLAIMAVFSIIVIAINLINMKVGSMIRGEKRKGGLRQMALVKFRFKHPDGRDYYRTKGVTIKNILFAPFVPLLRGQMKMFAITLAGLIVTFFISPIIGPLIGSVVFAIVYPEKDIEYLLNHGFAPSNTTSKMYLKNGEI